MVMVMKTWRFLAVIAIICILIIPAGFTSGKANNSARFFINSKTADRQVYDIRALFDRTLLGDDYPYDIDTIKNMTLQDLNWTVKDIDGDGNATWYINYTTPGGENKTITVIEGTFGGKDALGGDTYTMVPREYLMQGDVNHTKTIHLLHGAILLLPDGYPNCTGLGYGIFVNTHEVPSLQDPMFRAIAMAVVDTYDTPILLAGEFEQNWESFNYTGGQDTITFPSLLTVLYSKNITADTLKMFYIYPLIRMNLMAHTLFYRLVEQYGGNLDYGIMSEGASKQGYARWMVAMLDDRVKVAECDWMQIEDIYNSTRRYLWDWGRPPIDNSTGWANYSNQIETLMSNLGDYIEIGMKSNDPKMNLVYEIWDIYHQAHLLKNKSFMITITGSAGMGGYKNGEYETDHDGTYFPIGAETNFLKKLTSVGVEWRYGRDPACIGSPSAPDLQESRMIQNLFASADMLMLGDPTKWPKVENVSVSLTDINVTHQYMNITATIKYPQSNMSVILWYAANSDRRWNDPEHTSGIYKWTNISMVKVDNTTYRASVIIRKDLMYGYWVECSVPGRELPIIGPSRWYDASPIEVVHEYPHVAEGITDFYIKNVTLSTDNPQPGDDVYINITVYADRVGIWFDGGYALPELPHIRVKLIIDGNVVGEKEISIVKEVNVSFVWTATTEGYHNATVIVDSDNVLTEFREDNNKYDFLIPVGNVPEIGAVAVVFLAMMITAEASLVRFRKIIF